MRHISSASKRPIEKIHLFQLLCILLFHLTRGLVTHVKTRWSSIVRRKYQELYSLGRSDMSINHHKISTYGDKMVVPRFVLCPQRTNGVGD
ncbi:hypothetical protein TNCV_539521 [Trichonephila clavipes]|nr:hypothetical protein TNCV_539521 [Trichonephila clavipes]